LRRLSYEGREVVRLIDYPIRDADWGTLPTVTEDQHLAPDGKFFLRRFRTADGSIEGRVRAEVDRHEAGARLLVELDLLATRDVVVNRAGFVVLHPLDGVAGEGLSVRHPDGRSEMVHFPVLISPGQPVMDITSLGHRVGSVSVLMEFEGEVFEMEDQRNWSDASFKTYCRPLALPRPYELAAKDTIRQRIVVTFTSGETPAPTPAARHRDARVMMPDIFLAHEASVAPEPHPDLAKLAPQGVLLRVGATNEALPPHDRLPTCPVTLELVTGDDPAADTALAAKSVQKAGLSVARAVALPDVYLKSHQPGGPWPEGSAPMDLLPLLRAGFPSAEVGGGMLTNFTEFNRCPPDPARIDFATFGTTAIVHAADDLSVIETLEAIPQVIASARALSGDRPLRLGLMSIGMRSNPYGAGVIPNPDSLRLPMAIDDPRQRTPFAAAFAVALAAACARGGVASFAPAMTAGPLGLGDTEGPWPIWHAVAALAALAGVEVTVAGGPATGLVTIRGKGVRGIAGVAANLGPSDARLEAAVRIPDRAPPGWIDAPGPAGPIRLPPMSAAILRS
jgi:D-apionolactonase